jgi:hypothetical protein
VQQGTMKESENIDTYIEEYYWNNAYAQTQILQLTIIDPALYKDGNDLQKRFKDMSKIVISKNPTDKIYDCLSYDEDKDSTLMQIIFSYASVMELSTEKVDCKSIKKIIRLSKNYHELQKLSRR